MKKADLLNLLEREILISRSAWTKGVSLYAYELVETFNGEEMPPLEEMQKALLNGASCWADYSYGGCSLIYDADIAERLCTTSELKQKKGGELQPSSRETWLDLQARALNQAKFRIKQLIRAHSVQEVANAGA